MHERGAEVPSCPASQMDSPLSSHPPFNGTKARRPIPENLHIRLCPRQGLSTSLSLPCPPYIQVHFFVDERVGVYSSLQSNILAFCDPALQGVHVLADLYFWRLQCNASKATRVGVLFCIARCSCLSILSEALYYRSVKMHSGSSGGDCGGCGAMG